MRANHRGKSSYEERERSANQNSQYQQGSNNRRETSDYNRSRGGLEDSVRERRTGSSSPSRLKSYDNSYKEFGHSIETTDALLPYVYSVTSQKQKNSSESPKNGRDSSSRHSESLTNKRDASATSKSGSSRLTSKISSLGRSKSPKKKSSFHQDENPKKGSSFDQHETTKNTSSLDRNVSPRNKSNLDQNASPRERSSFGRHEMQREKSTLARNESQLNKTSFHRNESPKKGSNVHQDEVPRQVSSIFGRKSSRYTKTVVPLQHSSPDRRNDRKDGCWCRVCPEESNCDCSATAGDPLSLNREAVMRQRSSAAPVTMTVPLDKRSDISQPRGGSLSSDRHSSFDSREARGHIGSRSGSRQEKITSNTSSVKSVGKTAARESSAFPLNNSTPEYPVEQKRGHSPATSSPRRWSKSKGYCRCSATMLRENRVEAEQPPVTYTEPTPEPPPPAKPTIYCKCQLKRIEMGLPIYQESGNGPVLYCDCSQLDISSSMPQTLACPPIEGESSTSESSRSDYRRENESRRNKSNSRSRKYSSKYQYSDYSFTNSSIDLTASTDSRSSMNVEQRNFVNEDAYGGRSLYASPPADNNENECKAPCREKASCKSRYTKKESKYEPMDEPQNPPRSVSRTGIPAEKIKNADKRKTKCDIPCEAPCSIKSIPIEKICKGKCNYEVEMENSEPIDVVRKSSKENAYKLHAEMTRTNSSEERLRIRSAKSKKHEEKRQRKDSIHVENESNVKQKEPKDYNNKRRETDSNRHPVSHDKSKVTSEKKNERKKSSDGLKTKRRRGCECSENFSCSSGTLIETKSSEPVSSTKHVPLQYSEPPPRQRRTSDHGKGHHGDAKTDINKMANYEHPAQRQPIPPQYFVPPSAVTAGRDQMIDEIRCRCNDDLPPPEPPPIRRAKPPPIQYASPPPRRKSSETTTGCCSCCCGKSSPPPERKPPRESPPPRARPKERVKREPAPSTGCCGSSQPKRSYSADSDVYIKPKPAPPPQQHAPPPRANAQRRPPPQNTGCCSCCCGGNEAPREREVTRPEPRYVLEASPPPVQEEKCICVHCGTSSSSTVIVRTDYVPEVMNQPPAQTEALLSCGCPKPATGIVSQRVDLRKQYNPMARPVVSPPGSWKSHDNDGNRGKPRSYVSSRREGRAGEKGNSRDIEEIWPRDQARAYYVNPDKTTLPSYPVADVLAPYQEYDRYNRHGDVDSRQRDRNSDGGSHNEGYSNRSQSGRTSLKHYDNRSRRGSALTKISEKSVNGDGSFYLKAQNVRNGNYGHVSKENLRARPKSVKYYDVDRVSSEEDVMKVQEIPRSVSRTAEMDLVTSSNEVVSEKRCLPARRVVAKYLCSCFRGNNKEHGNSRNYNDDAPLNELPVRGRPKERGRSYYERAGEYYYR